MIRPNKCNLHAFQAIEDSAFININIPYYDMKKRFINYYYEDSEKENNDTKKLRICSEPPGKNTPWKKVIVID